MAKKFLRVLCMILLLCMCLVSCYDETPAEETTAEVSDTESTEVTEVETDAPEKKTVINAMSFNVWGQEASKTAANDSTQVVRSNVSIRGSKLNDLLNGEAIDVAGLQEVSANVPWVDWVETKLDKKYGYVAGNTTDIRSGVYIIYLKDKFEVLDSGVFWLSGNAPTTPSKFSDSEFQRICTWAVFKVKATGEIFLFMDTHLDTIQSARLKQVRVLMSQVPVLRDKVKTKYGVSDCVTVLVGDMNSNPKSEEYALITEVLRDSYVISKGTRPGNLLSTYTGFWYCRSELDYPKTEQRIDQIFVSKENCSVLNYKMIHTSTNLCPYGEYMSDHNAVIAQLELS